VDKLSTVKELFTGESEERYNVLREFYKKENISMKTDLTLEQINNIIVAEFVGAYIKKKWHIDLGIKEQITNPFKEYLVSLNRKGREEMVEVLAKQKEEEEKKTTMGKLKNVLGI
jgi:hypothetical protein